MRKCFIISPIGEVGSDVRKRSDEILNYIIRPVLNEFNYSALRADEISEFGLITNQVIEHIVYDELVICDMTYKNPNVYYELAIRHIVQKPIIQIIDEKEDLPFDVVNTRTIKINHRNITDADIAKNKIREYLKRIESGRLKIETPTSNIIDLDNTLFDKSPRSNLNIIFSKINRLLQEADQYNSSLNIQSEESINKMKDSDKLQSTVLVNLYHEIRTPINGILGFSELLTEEGSTEEEKKEFGKYIKKSAERVLKGITDALFLTSIQIDQTSINIENIDISALLNEIFNNYRDELKHYNSKLDLELIRPKKPILSFNTDPNYLKKILQQLIDNAKEYTISGKIEISFELHKSELFCQIKDSDFGISSKNSQMILDAFQKDDDGKICEELGNGLSIAKSLVQKLGGRIWVESKEGVGSTFFISIPNLEQ